MLVCHCKAVNDRTIRQIVAEGAVDEVRRLCATSNVLVKVA